ncbi:glutaredoxin-like protein NrdH [Nocardia higoensis]|uniref:Glutaredoxin-like protein NrdH n=1 Tax=Nocardia higoensis TaxID=228599 RepID=A0ABS0DI97_9NOCA|nr:glutaredoxin-like protein NrdH [Nocardia higoensis]MBF6358182.1 glutaredoxin-like protein NrdH [Nocardia higoensis]
MRITVYTKPNCVQCRFTYKKLDDLEAEYDLVYMTEDPDALAYIQSLGYKQAPVVVAGEQHWGGYAPDKLAWAAAQQTINRQETPE